MPEATYGLRGVTPRVLCSLLALLMVVGVACSSGEEVPMPPVSPTLPSGPAMGAETASIDSPLYAPSERFGFVVTGPPGTIASFDVAQLNAGWYSDWGFSADPVRPAGIEYVQLVSVSAGLLRLDQKALRMAVQGQPGSLWIIGNEPERRALEGASKVYDYAGLTPQEYAMIYHNLYRLIKDLDPTAKIAIGAVVQPSPLRLRWLDMVLDAYQGLAGTKMPVDVWNIHVQLMREKLAIPGCGDCWGADIPAGIDDVNEGLVLEVEDNVNLDLFQTMIWDFRRWMKEKGERDKPLIVSEYGVLMPSEYLGETVEEGDKMVEEFMLASFDFLMNTRDDEVGYAEDGNRLVQRWLWYSLNDVPFQYNEKLEAWIGFNGSLFDWQGSEWPGVMTPLGKAYAAYTAGLMEATP